MSKLNEAFEQSYARRKLALQNRIQLLSGRGYNSNIINKLQRQLNNLEAEYNTRKAEDEE